MSYSQAIHIGFCGKKHVGTLPAIACGMASTTYLGKNRESDPFGTIAPTRDHVTVRSIAHGAQPTVPGIVLAVAREYGIVCVSKSRRNVYGTIVHKLDIVR